METAIQTKSEVQTGVVFEVSERALQQLKWELQRINPNIHTEEGMDDVIAWLAKHAPTYPYREPSNI